MNILITGGTSMVGKHLRKYLSGSIYNTFYLSRKNCNLTDYKSVEEAFNKFKPNIVVHLAAKVGGIMDNINNPVEFFEDNIYINTNVLKAAYKYKAERFIGILSTCIYPDTLPVNQYPLKEETLHLGPPALSNFSYGYAKRCLGVQIDSYNKQYGTNYNYLIPCNLYSEYDHFTGDKAHFVSSLVHKIATAKKRNEKYITLFGTGKPLRQFMYADDLAQIIYRCITTNTYPNANVATNEVYSVKQIAETALTVCDATDLEIKWDSTKPDGGYRKDVSSEALLNVFPDFKYTLLTDGIKKTFDNYFHGLVT